MLQKLSASTLQRVMTLAPLSAILILTGVGAVLICRFATVQFNRDDDKARLWSKLNSVGVAPSGIFRWTRALLWSLNSSQQNAHDGYQSFTKARGLPFALPTMVKDGAAVVLPPSMLYLLNKPESEVRAFDAQLETFQPPYMISDRDVYMNIIHLDVVRKHMVSDKHVGAMAITTSEELDAAFNDILGNSSEWRTVNGWDLCGRIITRVAIRILIGVPLCRDEALYEQSRLFSDSVFIGAAMIKCFPPVVRPLIGPFLALRTKFYRARCLKILVPFIEERIRQWLSNEQGDNAPNDFFQWTMPKSAKEGAAELNAVRLANRLLTLNVMSIVAIGYVFSHCVIDLYSSSSKEKWIEGLEAECRQVSAEFGGLSTKTAIDRLYRTDSTLRESMRVSDVAITALGRDVVANNLDLGNGIEIPRGIRIVFPAQPIHQDPEYYPNPLQFDPFRFSRGFEGAEDACTPGGSAAKRESLTTITDSFLAFGYGKHSCPGRHFAAQTMKQALAHLILNYDVEVVNKPERRQVMLNMMVPPSDVKLRVRRKTHSFGVSCMSGTSTSTEVHS